MTQPQPTGAQDACARPAPPAGRRFQPGHSGNPRGGPRRPAPRTAEVEWLFSQSFTVEIAGERQRLPLAKALLLAMAHRALKGDARAASELLALHGKAEETRAAQAAAKAKKAAEDRARRAAEEAEREEEEELARPITIHFGCTKFEEALSAVGILGPKRHGGCYPIRRWAYDVLTGADPGLATAFTDRDRLSLSEWLDEDEGPLPEDVVGRPPP